MHLVFLPLSIVKFPIRPVVLSFAADLIERELALIVTGIGKGQFSSSIFLAIFVFSFILRSIGPGLHSDTMLLVVHPLSFVESSIAVGIDSLSMSFII
jgi:hypothetical protein